MKFPISASSILNKIFLIIPFALFLFSLFAPLKFGIPSGSITDTTQYSIWKYWMQLSICFYGISAVIVFIFWLFQGMKNALSFLKTYRNWFIGLLLTFFSFALAGLVIDLGYAIYFIFLSLRK
jgi:hypothetical protein